MGPGEDEDLTERYRRGQLPDPPRARRIGTVDGRRHDPRSHADPRRPQPRPRPGLGPGPADDGRDGRPRRRPQPRAHRHARPSSPTLGSPPGPRRSSSLGRQRRRHSRRRRTHRAASGRRQGRGQAGEPPRRHRDYGYLGCRQARGRLRVDGVAASEPRPEGNRPQSLPRGCRWRPARRVTVRPVCRRRAGRRGRQGAEPCDRSAHRVRTAACRSRSCAEGRRWRGTRHSADVSPLSGPRPRGRRLRPDAGACSQPGGDFTGSEGGVFRGALDDDADRGVAVGVADVQ